MIDIPEPTCTVVEVVKASNGRVYVEIVMAPGTIIYKGDILEVKKVNIDPVT